jgi:starch phosphorylase
MNIRFFNVAPSLPKRLERLIELAYNLRWAWDHDTIELFRRVDRDLWETCNHNPVLLLGQARQERLESVASDEGFLAQYDRCLEALDQYLTRRAWFQKAHPEQSDLLVAYFSAEYGLTECLPIYSGGLGILAGDHLKSASDLGLPVVGLGLLYQEGYFQQYLNADGWQQERYPDNDFHTLPIRVQRKDDSSPLQISLEFPGRDVHAQVWRAQIGRVPLYLLDTNIPENAPADRTITAQLYGGNDDTRISQEIVLGIGGIRALDALGLAPTVCHMNEGHSGFLGLERIRSAMEEHGLAFAEALEATRGGNVFTTHTPVPAGIDEFAPEDMERYFGEYRQRLGLTKEGFLALGRAKPDEAGAKFNMALMAMKLAGNTNGVSELHGQVTRRMWRHIWPEIPEDEIPITSVTNGTHAPSWVSRDLAQLSDRYLGPKWRDEPIDQLVWSRVDQIPDEEMWRTHERRRERLVAYARRQLQSQLRWRGASAQEAARAMEALNSAALTIGFARRFATYKRATLMLKDVDRLRRILCDHDKPVQIIFAGKAHPRDKEGKELIRQIVHLTRDEDFRRRIVFIENYDMTTARYLVQGVDVWLNTPRRPMEASGTSGMKAAMNGALNLSVLDGWWCEAYDTQNGWAIGHGEEYDNYTYQDEVESGALFDVLEAEVVPLFYRRGSEGLPRGWIAKMKASMRTICPVFNTNRMVFEYARRFYLPATKRWQTMTQDDMARARELAAWKQKLTEHWKEIRIEQVVASATDGLKVGEELRVTAKVHLGTVDCSEVSVQVYHGDVGPAREIIRSQTLGMRCMEHTGDGVHSFEGDIPCRVSGRRGFGIRVVPLHRDLENPLDLHLILWA